MHALLACVAISGALLLTANGPAHAEELAALVPPEVDGWKGDGMDSVYGPEDLYNYINGGAEVYIALNFKQVFARRFEKSGQPEIICDLFDMGSARDAYGAYHHDMREGKSAGVGNESEVSETSIAFWKGRYFVSIVAFDDTPEAQHAMAGLAATVAKRITEDGEPPRMLELLPRDGLQANRLHFFHDHLTLHSHYLLARDNVLQLSRATDCLLARYRKTTDRQKTEWALLVVNYPQEGAAEKAFGALLTQVLKDADKSGAVQRSDGLFAAARVVDKTLILALDAPSRQVALESVAATAMRVVGW